MRQWLALLLATLSLLAWPAAAKPKLAGYDGADAGRLILTITEGPGAYGYDHAIYVRRRGERRGFQISFAPSSLFTKDHADFGGGVGKDRRAAEFFIGRVFDPGQRGMVTITRLPPGAYEIYDFGAYQNNGFTSARFSFREDVSIPFEIKPGASLYLGEFRVIGIDGKNFFGATVTAGFRFEVGDRSPRDLEIAMRKDPAIGEPEIGVPDVRSLDHPLLSQAGPPGPYDGPVPPPPVEH